MSLQLNGNGTATAVLNGGRLDSLPAGASAAWSSSDEKVATVTRTPDNPLNAVISPVGVGTCTIVCVVTNADGSNASGDAGLMVVPAITVNVTSVSVTITENNPGTATPATPAPPPAGTGVSTPGDKGMLRS